MAALPPGFGAIAGAQRPSPIMQALQRRPGVDEGILPGYHPAPNPGFPPTNPVGNGGLPPYHNPQPPPYQGSTQLTAPQLRAAGEGLEGAKLWEGRHPWAVNHGHVPGWVQQELGHGLAGEGAGGLSGLAGLTNQFSPSQPNPADIIAAAAGSNPNPAEAVTDALNPQTRINPAFNSLRGGRNNRLEALLHAFGGGSAPHHQPVAY